MVHPNYISVKHAEPLAKKTLCINWIMTNVCNFNCTYCPSHLHSGTILGPRPSQVMSIVSQIIASRPSVHKFFELTGGEVTYYKDLLTIANHVKSEGADFDILSNGHREIAFWKKLKPFLDHICFSYHPENRYADHFIEVTEYLSEDVSVHVNLMMKPELFDECLNIANRIYKLQRPSLSLQPLHEQIAGKKFKYSAKQLNVLEQQLKALNSMNHGPSFFSPPPQRSKVYRGSMIFSTKDGQQDIYSTPEILAHHLNNWWGWSCYSGLENLSIDLRGNVKRAHCVGHLEPI